ncbi:MAG: peptidylprolyl isomerase [Burkholderiales bacterium]|jgi:cyclophilin family peptidyl-prolyl cis-trans isomerase|nr:peptidylprolyl isomerase [Nitrosomonadaceae bacterium]
MLTYLRFAQNAASRIVGICLGLTLTVCAVPLLAQTPAQPPAQTQPAAAASTSTPRSFGDIVAAAPADAWRTPDPQNVVYLDIPTGRVVIELAPNLAPEHVANIRTLIREKYFDGLAIVRSQDNYVVQWGDPVDKVPRKPIGSAKPSLAPEFERTLSAEAFKRFAFDALPDRDGYAAEVGFASGFHAGRDPKTNTVWGAHCYGVVGVGRGNESTSGNGASLYAIIGHAPRHLDRNITVVGRVLQGMPLLSILPRGTRPLGFYATPAETTPLRAVSLAADLPASERVPVEVMRTDSPSFTQAVEALRNRGAGDPNGWFKRPAGYVELCNVSIPVRLKPTK